MKKETICEFVMHEQIERRRNVGRPQKMCSDSIRQWTDLGPTDAMRETEDRVRWNIHLNYPVLPFVLCFPL